MREQVHLREFLIDDSDTDPSLLSEEDLSEIRKSHALFLNNTIPTNDEAARIRDSISADQPYLDALIAKIAKLSEEHAELVEVTRLRSSVISPVRRLPAELILEIISHAMDIDPSNSAVSGTDTNGGPWMYAKVCRLWRAVANGCPKLWSRLNIKFDDRNLKVKPAIVKEALERSQQCLLTIQLITVAPFTSVAKDVLDLLYAHSRRWQNVKLRLETTLPMIKMFQRFQGRLTALRSLDFTHRRPSHGKHEFPAPVVTFLVSNSPNLRRLAVRYQRVPTPDFTALKIPYGQLEFFERSNEGGYFWRERSTDPDHEISMLKLMPNISELSFTEEFTSRLNLNPPARGSLTLRHVHKATFSASALLPILTLPTLSSVQLHFNKHNKSGPGWVSYRSPQEERPISNDENLLTEFSELLSRSSSPLRELTLDSLPDISLAYDLIQALPLTVDTLRITRCGYHESLFSQFTGAESLSSPLILPRLQYLSFALILESSNIPSPKSHLDVNSLKKMIRSRYRSPNSSLYSLRSVSIVATKKAATSKEVDKILALSNVGLHVSLNLTTVSLIRRSAWLDLYDDRWFSYL
jgi:hypothetical protein